jgi:hypothetical protein
MNYITGMGIYFIEVLTNENYSDRIALISMDIHIEFWPE